MACPPVTCKLFSPTSRTPRCHAQSQKIEKILRQVCSHIGVYSSLPPIRIVLPLHNGDNTVPSSFPFRFAPRSHLASNCTILPRTKNISPRNHRRIWNISYDKMRKVRRGKKTHRLVLSLYSTRCPHSLHRIGSPRFSETFELQSPQR